MVWVGGGEVDGEGGVTVGLEDGEIVCETSVCLGVKGGRKLLIDIVV